MSQEHPTHDELVGEVEMLTAGLHDDVDYCEQVHHDVFGTEGQPHVIVLFDGFSRFVGVFESVKSALGWVLVHDSRYRDNPTMKLEECYSYAEMAVVK